MRESESGRPRLNRDKLALEVLARYYRSLFTERRTGKRRGGDSHRTGFDLALSTRSRERASPAGFLPKSSTVIERNNKPRKAGPDGAQRDNTRRSFWFDSKPGAFATRTDVGSDSQRMNLSLCVGRKQSCDSCSHQARTSPDVNFLGPRTKRHHLTRPIRISNAVVRGLYLHLHPVQHALPGAHAGRSWGSRREIPQVHRSIGPVAEPSAALQAGEASAIFSNGVLCFK